MDYILDGLAHARTYPYKGEKNLLATVQQEQAQQNTTGIREYVFFSHVDDKAFADLSREDNYSDEDDYEGRNNYDIIPTLIKDYSRLHNRLIFKTTVNGSHEQLHNRLALLINYQVLKLGLDGQLRFPGQVAS